MIRTGIGGWIYPEWRGGNFYPEGLPQKRELEYASRHVGAIEINSTFYKLQNPDLYRRWREQVPEGFVFAIKGSRFIINRKDLATAAGAFDKFFAQGFEELGDALGPMLWQLAATKKFVGEEVEAFFASLPRTLGRLTLRHVIEARHESFDCAEFVEIARAANVAIAYVEDDTSPTIAERTADFAYMRCKRLRPDCPTGYSPPELDRLATLCRKWAQVGDVFTFFIDGEAKERAPAAAMALAERVRG